MASSGNNTRKRTTSNSRSGTGASRTGSGQGQRRTQSKSRSTGNRSSSRTQSTRYVREPLDKSVQNEIILIVILAICAVLFLCNFGKIGLFGNAVCKFMFGTFGLIEYILPIGIIIFTLFRIFNIDNPVVTRKLFASVGIAVLVMIVCDLFAGPIDTSAPVSISGIFNRCGDGKIGGGLIGGLLAYFGVKLLGRAGTWILIFVLLCVFIILITGKSLFTGIKEQGQILYEDSREEGRYRKEQSLIKREEKNRARQEKLALKREMNDELERNRQLKREEKENEQILRMDKKVSGVSFDTTIKRGVENETEPVMPKVRDDVHEITLTDEEEYIDKITNSAVIHAEKVVPSSDLTREITFDYEDDYQSDTAYEPEAPVREITIDEPVYTSAKEDVSPYAKQEIVNPVSEIKEAETTYQAPVRMNGKTYGADPSAYGVGGAKPEASYSTEYGNTMAVTNTKTRPSATMKKPDNDGAAQRAPSPASAYRFPPIELLTKGKGANNSGAEKELRETAEKLQKTLETFGVNVKITEISRGPAVTRYEMQPELGVKVSKIVGLSDDIKMALAATDIRIEAPIPGKSAVGIEVPNKENEAVSFRDLIESKEFKNSSGSLPFAVGKDISGQTIIHDIAKMPHVLIAGATGSGKSVCINTIIMSILYKKKPDEVRLILIDPKIVELSVYNTIPHLLLPVVTDPKKAAGALGWAVKEMTDRYAKFADAGVRDLKGYNDNIEDKSLKMPHILIVVDELADLMMVSPGEVEEHICRLAQLARACGIHLVIATQRPSVDVITGLIKANMPSRIAFAVSSGVDSRTILDMVGAEKLLGKGDMLFYPQGLTKPSRVQGAFVPDSDVQKVAEFFKNLDFVPGNNQDISDQVSKVGSGGSDNSGAGGDSGSDYDPFFADAGRFIIDKEKASIGALQRLLKIGFNRAARIMDQLAAEGVVGEEAGTKPREILMSADAFEDLLERLGL